MYNPAQRQPARLSFEACPERSPTGPGEALRVWPKAGAAPPDRVTPPVTSGNPTPPLLSPCIGEECLRLSSFRIIAGTSCLLFGAAAWRLAPHSAQDFVAEAQTTQTAKPAVARQNTGKLQTT